jgi:hypothetical protein
MSPLTAKIASWLLIFPSIIVGIVAVELFGRLVLPPRDFEGSGMRNSAIFFYSDGAIFRNEGDIFTYEPHREIRNVTAFFPDDKFEIEYDYRFRTNNFGLVQDADIVPERKSLLLLGDSFTEGQGAEPWFRLLSPEVEKLGLQPINGGLIATGFRQWLELERYLTGNKVQIRKVVVLYIAGDYSRGVWNFTLAALQCLTNLPLCRVEDSVFYRLPPPDELSSWIAKLRAVRPPMTHQSWLGAHVAAVLPLSYSVYQYLRTLNAQMGRESSAAISELIRIYGPENVAFIHLPEKTEVENQGFINFVANLRLKIVEAFIKRSIRGQAPR